MSVSVLPATNNDVDDIMLIGEDPAFTVTPRIKFYDREEVIEWANNREANILLIMRRLDDRAPVGFCFCKVMSKNWAMLDNFFVLPEYRDQGFGQELINALRTEIRKRRIGYVSCLVEVGKVHTVNRLKRYGFEPGKVYEWRELFLV